MRNTDLAMAGEQPHWQHVRVHPLVWVFVGAAALVLLLWFWNSLTTLLLLLIAAGACAATCMPLVRRLPGPRLLVGAAVGIAFDLLLLGVLGLAGWLMYGPIQQELENWPETREMINQWLARWTGRLNLQTVTAEQLAQRAWAWFTRVAEDGIAQVANWTVAVFVGLLLLLFGTIYLLALSPGTITRPAGKLLSPRFEPGLHGMIGDLEHMLRQWLLGTLASMTIVGTLAYAAYWFIGLKFAATLALIAGLAAIVPTLGPAAALVLAMLVAATQSNTLLVQVAIAYLVIQLVESYILQPLIMRKAVHLPPIITLFTLVLWARLIGPLGLLLGLPLDLVIWSALEHFVLRPKAAAQQTKREHARPRHDAGTPTVE